MANTYDQLTKDYYRQLYILIGVSVVALGLLVAVIVLARKGNGSGPSGFGKGKGKEQKPDDDQRWTETEEEIPTSKIKRYSREEYDRQSSGTEPDPDYQEESMDEPVYAGDAEQKAMEEDDFIEETSLEDFERDLKSNEAGNSEKDEDDFEFLDLDD